MDDYISRQAAIIAINKYNDEYVGYVEQPTEKLINELNAISGIEVVRCKDCRHRAYDESRDMYYCEMFYGLGSVTDNNYCSYGERADK